MEIFRDSILQAEITSANSALKSTQNKENVPPPDSPVALRESHAGNRVPLKEIAKSDDKKLRPFVMINLLQSSDTTVKYNGPPKISSRTLRTRMQQSNNKMVLMR